MEQVHGAMALDDDWIAVFQALGINQQKATGGVYGAGV